MALPRLTWPLGPQGEAPRRAAGRIARPLSRCRANLRQRRFISYSHEQLRSQLGGWADEGIRMVKMKVGRDPDRDLARVRVAREAIGPEDAAVRRR